jgi:hypothetical protein
MYLGRIEIVSIMARSIKKIAKSLGAKIIARVPAAGGGAFGAARLGRMARDLANRRGRRQDNRFS